MKCQHNQEHPVSRWSPGFAVIQGQRLSPTLLLGDRTTGIMVPAGRNATIRRPACRQASLGRLSYIDALTSSPSQGVRFASQLALEFADVLGRGEGELVRPPRERLANVRSERAVRLPVQGRQSTDVRTTTILAQGAGIICYRCARNRP
jgi:hypothetical protein